MTPSESEVWFGSDLTDDDCALLQLKLTIAAEHLVEEAELRKTKWFDYRMWPAYKATHFFAHCYAQACRDCFASTKDKRKAADIKPLHEDVFKSSEKTAMWLARQSADRLGIRYEFGLRFTMNRFAGRGWKFFPRPNQLYSEELLLDMADAWKVECSTRLQFPKNPHFRNENYVGDEYQLAWHQWIVQQLKRRSSPHLGIAQAVYKEKLLTEQTATEAFSPEIMSRARHFAGFMA